MRRYGNAIGALLALLLPTLVIVPIAARAQVMPRVVSVWPVLAALGASVVTWWLQGLIYAVLAKPQLRGLRVGGMFRVEMAGLFVALISPLRGAELPYKAYLLKRLDLSGGEASTVVGTRVLLDVAVLTPGALVALPLYSDLPEVKASNLLFVGLVATVAAVAICVRREARRRAKNGTSRLGGSARRARAAAKISGFLRDMRRSFASYWRQGQRAILLYAIALTTVYWVLRLSAGPLALMAVGWSGNWLPVIAAQLLLVSFVLPFAPTPGGGGARELGLATLLSGCVPEGQLLGGLIFYTSLSHWLPLIASAFYAGHELWRGSFRPAVRKTTNREGYAWATKWAIPILTSPRCWVLSITKNERKQQHGSATRQALRQTVFQEEAGRERTSSDHQIL